MQEAELSLSLRKAVGLARIERIAIVIVDARSSPSYEWDRAPTRPGAGSLLWQAISLPIDRNTSESVAALGDRITEWRLRDRVEQLQRQLDPRSAVDTRIPDIEFPIIEVSFDAVADPELRSYLQNLPTSLALPTEAADRLRAAGAELLGNSPRFRSLVESLGKARR